MRVIHWIAGAALCGVSVVALAQTEVQVPAGYWAGELNAGGQLLRLELELDRNEQGDWNAVVVSVDQGGARIPVSGVSWKAPELTLQLAVIAAEFDGSLEGESIVGTWQQGGAELPLIWNRAEPKEEVPVSRTQDPTGDLPYRERELELEGPVGVLSGTLTLPGREEGGASYPLVVLISGSGLQDRDETIFGHRPFAVLADSLTRRGLAVFRYDDRGFGKSTGDASSATTLDFSEDTRAVVVALRERDDINPEALALIGHSEGALIAAKLAPELGASAVVSVAGPVVTGVELLTAQTRDLLLLGGSSAETAEARAGVQRSLVEVAASELDSDTAREKLVAQLAGALGVDTESGRDALVAQVSPLLQPWTRYFLRLDPKEWWRPVEVPVLAIFGGKDVQVSSSLNAPLLEALLTRPQQEVVVFPELNHLMQPAVTGLPAEYEKIEVTIDPIVLERMGVFLESTLTAP